MPKTEWAANPIPKLGKEHDAVSEWKPRAALATEAANHSGFITKMANGLERTIDKQGTLKIKIYPDKQKKEYFDILEAIDETGINFIKHMVSAAYHAAAPIGEGKTLKELTDDAALARKAYRELKYYMTGFNKQMYDAVYDAKPTVFAQANRNYGQDETNPFMGIIAWCLITQGVTVTVNRKRIDNLLKRIGFAVTSPVQRAVDVSGYLALVQDAYLDFIKAGGTEVAADDAILPGLLDTLSDGQHVYDRMDTKEWKEIGSAAADFKKMREADQNISWPAVHSKLLLTYDGVFDSTVTSAKGYAANGPAPHKAKPTFPMGVAFYAGQSDAQDQTHQELVMATFDKAATAADYRALLDKGTPLPGSHAGQKKATSAPGAGGSADSVGKKGKGSSQTAAKEGTAIRDYMPRWVCGQQLEDGKKCGALNWYYQRAKNTDATVNNKCSKCGKSKKVDDDSSPKKAMASLEDTVKGLTEQLQRQHADQQELIKSVAMLARPTPNEDQARSDDEQGRASGGNRLGLACLDKTPPAMPNFDDFRDKGSVGMEDPQVAMLAAAPGAEPEPQGGGELPRRGHSISACVMAIIGVAVAFMLWIGDCIKEYWDQLKITGGAIIFVGILAGICFCSQKPTRAAITAGFMSCVPLAETCSAPGPRALAVNPNAFGLDPLSTRRIITETRASKWGVGGTVRRACSSLRAFAGKSDTGVSAEKIQQFCFASAAGFTEGRVFLDSCCSRTIIHDASMLSNIRPMRAHKSIIGIGGFTQIRHVGDLHMSLVDIQGRTKTVVIKDVYHDPSLSYNLVSVSDMSREQYRSTFSSKENSLVGPAGSFELQPTCDVYALPLAQPTMAYPALGRMTEEELMHLRLNHAVSPHKMAILSNSGARGIRAGLKPLAVKCHTCQHANCTRSNAAPAATTDSFDLSFDLVDMSSIPTIGGMRYVTIFVHRKTRFVYTFLHERKDEFPGILDKLLARFEDKDRPRVLKCDGAGEYDSPAFQAVIDKYPGTIMHHSNAHEQSGNGMAEKMVDRLGRMLRATLLQSQMPPEFWGAATILLTDIYNCTPHRALDHDSPYYRLKGAHPDLSFFRPFGSAMIVHQGKDLVEHRKLAPRGEKCLYLGTGNAYGRRCFIGYSPRLHRVYCTLHATFDETLFPMRTVDQRARGYADNEPLLETLSLYHDMPNATIEDLAARIQNQNVPCNTEWSLADIMRLPATLDTSSRGDVADGPSLPAGSSGDNPLDGDTTINNVTLRRLKESVFAHGRPEPYATIAPGWQAAGSKKVGNVTNNELAEYLIGIEAEIKCPPSFWPKDKCSWTVKCVEHNADGRARGGHRFKVLLIRAEPAYKGAGQDQLWEASISAWHIRQALNTYHDAGRKTLEQMFDSNYQGMATRALAALRRMGGRLTKPAPQDSKLKRMECKDTEECAQIGMAWAAAICEENAQEYAGVRSVPRSYYDIKGRPDANDWYAACDKELLKLFEMNTFAIVDASSVPDGVRIMETCFSFKRKEDSEGNLKEKRCRINADGRQQDKDSCGDTFAPTSKFSCIRTICAIAAQEGLKLYQFDVKGAFLMAPCEEPIYLNLPGRYRLPKGKALKCLRYIYGLRQSAAPWHKLFAKWLKDYGFENIDSDWVTWSMTDRKSDGTPSKLLLTVHVDDGLAACNDPDMYQAFLEALRKDFELSNCGELDWLLGCKVEQEEGMVRLHQEKYCNDVLKRFQMADCRPVSTPCEPNMHLTDADCPPLHQRNPEVVRNYQMCIGALMYLTCFTRGDCSFAVNQCARFMSNPGPTHIAAARRILRYLAGTRSLGLTYRRAAADPALASVGKASEPNQLSASADADHAGGKDRRSISGWAVMLNGAMVTWSSKRQPVTAISSTESEFYAVSQCALDCVYLRRVMSMMGYQQTRPTSIAQDNAACIYLVRGSGMYNRAKHIDTRVYRVRELASGEAPEVEVYKIAGEYQPADIFTKGLPRVAFERHRRTLMGEQPRISVEE